MCRLIIVCYSQVEFYNWQLTTMRRSVTICSADLVQKKGISKGITHMLREWQLGITISTEPFQRTLPVRDMEAGKQNRNGDRGWRKGKVMRDAMNWRKPIYFALTRRMQGHPWHKHTHAHSSSSSSSSLNTGCGQNTAVSAMNEKEAVEDLEVLAR